MIYSPLLKRLIISHLGKRGPPSRPSVYSVIETRVRFYIQNTHSHIYFSAKILFCQSKPVCFILTEEYIVLRESMK